MQVWCYEILSPTTIISFTSSMSCCIPLTCLTSPRSYHYSDSKLCRKHGSSDTYFHTAVPSFHLSLFSVGVPDLLFPSISCSRTTTCQDIFLVSTQLQLQLQRCIKEIGASSPLINAELTEQPGTSSTGTSFKPADIHFTSMSFTNSMDRSYVSILTKST